MAIAGFFEIRDDLAFFSVVSNALKSYRSAKTKRPEDLLLLVLGLTHLREWIAPDYKRGAAPTSAGERFAAMLYEDPNYQTLLQLANHAKHQRRAALPKTQSTYYTETVDDRDTPINSWLDFDTGPASSHKYGNEDLEQIFLAVATLYEEKWFTMPIDERLA